MCSPGGSTRCASTGYLLRETVHSLAERGSSSQRKSVQQAIIPWLLLRFPNPRSRRSSPAPIGERAASSPSAASFPKQEDLHKTQGRPFPSFIRRFRSLLRTHTDPCDLDLSSPHSEIVYSHFKTNPGALLVPSAPPLPPCLSNLPVP